MPTNDGPPENVAAFLTELGKTLKAQEGMDGGLAEIVAQHLLTVTPAAHCVDQALAAIKVLAAERANT